MTPAQLAIAYAADLVLGDPEWFPHPVRGFGWLAHLGDRRALRRDVLTGAALTGSIVGFAWALGRPRNAAWQIGLAWTCLATRSLLDEARAVVAALQSKDLDVARRRLARIVGRDTEHLSESEIARAVIETLAESACDGIVAPLFWLVLGGLPAAMAYKAANTLDSMIGHREPAYLYFGRAAARLDDALNFIPARLAALMMITIAGPNAAIVWLRDGNKHASPNAGQGEAAMAGALGVCLGGARSYDGRRSDAPVLNEDGRPPTAHDAWAAMRIVMLVSGMAFGVALLVLRCRRR